MISTYKVMLFRLRPTQTKQVTSELLDGVTSGVSAVIPSRISIIKTSGVDDMDITGLPELINAPICLLEPLIQLALSHVLWPSLMRCSCIIKRVMISCVKNTCLCSPSIKCYQVNAFINICIFLNILLISFIFTGISENTVPYYSMLRYKKHATYMKI